MNTYSQISAFCPCCNSTKFLEDGESYVCANCGKSFTKEQIVNANMPRVKANAENLVKNEILPELLKQSKNNIKKALKRNPYIKIK